MLNVTYCFYWHLNPNFPAQEIIEAINDKDYEKFMKYYEEWNTIGKKQGMLYLPDDASVCAEKDYEHMVTTNILNKHNFMQITHCEYECG